MNDKLYLQQAIRISQESVDAGNYPVGAIIVKDDEVIATGIYNGKQLCGNCGNWGQVLTLDFSLRNILLTLESPILRCSAISILEYPNLFLAK